MVDYRREPVTAVAPTTAAASRRFRLGFALVAMAYVVVLLSASLYANPHGFFGRAGQPALYNDRLSKAEYLATLPASDMPNAWIIGSSNMMSFQVSTVNRLFGVNAFNLGSFWSRAEDEWAWVNFLLRDLRSQPKLVILGVEPWTFADDTRGPPLLAQYQRRLLSTPALRQYLEDAPDWKFTLSRLLDSLTLENARLLARGFLHYGASRITLGPFWVQGFNKDGTNAKYSSLVPDLFLPAAVNDSYRRLFSSANAVARIDMLDPERRALIDAGHIRLETVVNFLPGDRMLPSRIALFTRTLDLLEERGIPVVLVMLPVHPYYYDTLLANTRHAAHVAEVRRMLSALQQRHRNIRAVMDASHIARFGGDPAAFHDPYHMTPANTDRVLAGVCQIWCGDR